MYFFLNNRRNLPAINNSIVNPNIYSKIKMTREDFLKYEKNNKLEEYYELKKKVYSHFKKNLDANNFINSKTLFDNSTIYGLHKTHNICSCSNWKVYEDIFEIGEKNDYDKFIWFYENIVKNIESHIKKESSDNDKLIFYDSTYLSNNEIHFDIIKRFSNMIFRDLVYSYSLYRNKNENTYKILEYLIDSNNLDIENIYGVQNTVCNIGDLEIFKFIDSKVSIDYNYADNEFFISACSKGHLEIAKILYEKNFRKIDKIDETFFITCRDCENIDLIKWLCKIHDGKHITNLKTLFNSQNYNNETKEYLISIGYIF